MIRNLLTTSRKNWLSGVVLALLLFGPASAWAQTTLINETFESTNSFTIVNGTATNTWNVGTPPGNGPTTTGTKAAYISNNAGAAHAYTTSAISVVHMYQDVAFPAGETVIRLSLDWRGLGESDFVTYDNLQVFLVPTTFTPTAASTGAVGTISRLQNSGYTPLITLTGMAAYSTSSVALPTSAAGTTQRLVFQWYSDATGGSQPPAAFDNVRLTSAVAVPICGIKSVGPTGNYASLTAALAAVSTNGVCGPLVFELQPTYVSTSETFPLVYSTAAGVSATNTVTIRPQGGTTPAINLSIGSANTTATFNINAGKYLIIDGRPGGSGSTVSGAALATDLTIANTSTSGIPVNFINDATFNTLQHCQVKGVGTASTAANVSFSGTATVGNSDNTVQFNSLGDGATTPTALIYSGSSTNARNVIQDNNLFNFYGTGAAYAIYLSSAGTSWTIQRNSLYQTASRAGVSATLYGINIAGGNGHLVSGNFIGGTAPNAGGTALTLSSSTVASRFVGILLNAAGTVAAGTAPSIQGNTVANFTWLCNSTVTTAPGIWAGIYVQSDANVGTVSGNTIGSSTGPVSITVSASGSISYGVVISGGPTTVNLANTTISNLTVAGSVAANAASIAGIQTAATTTNITQSKLYNLTAGNAGIATGILCFSNTTNITNNLIGDLKAPASTSLVAVSGIMVPSTATAANIYYNTINLNATSTGATFGTSGIYLSSTTPTATLRNNIVVNKSTPVGTGGLTVGLRRTATAVTGYASASNNNLYFAGAAAANRLLYYDGTNSYQTLATFKAGAGVSPRETASVTEDVTFLGTAGTASGFLHIDPTTPTRVESGGASISGITTDFDGDTRNATTPDIGADEGTFTPIQTVDVGVSALTAPASNQICYTTAETVTVAVRNQNAAALALAPTTAELTVSGTITSTATGFVTITLPTQTITSGTIAGNGTLAVTFPGTYDLSAPGVYTFNISATVTGDADATNNALPGTPAGTNTRTVSSLAAGTASASPTNSCGPTTVSLTATGVTGGTLNWYSSADGFVASIGTGSPFVTPSISATTSYQAKVVCGTNSSAASNTVIVTVNNPTITGTNTPVSRCGPGSVTLTATSTSGSTPQYYTAATGGPAFASGASATVSVTGNATYYVAARDNNPVIYTAGLTNNVGNGTYVPVPATDYPLGFNVTTAGTLASVDVYPSAAGSLVITVYNVPGGNPGAAGTAAGSVTATFTAAQVNTLVTVPINLALAAGAYKITTPSGSVGRLNPYTGTYPLTSGPISVVGSYNATTSSSYLSSSAYNGFFNLSFSAIGCESARTPIAVNITAAPALTPATTTQTACANSANTITFAGFPTLTVTPAATAVVNGQDITFTPASTTTYTVTGTDGVCSNTATVTLTVVPLVAGTASASPGNFCGAASGTPALSLSGTSGQTGFVWQQSGTGLAGSFADIAGSANQTPFTAPAISATTYYQAVATCGTNTVASNVLAVLVGAPAVATTNSPVARCGAGSVTLQATASAGSTPFYYATATSVLPLGSGASQAVNVTATPATQTYYVAARDQSTAFVAGLTSNAAGNGTLTSGTGLPLGFAVTAPGTLQSVDIYPATGTTSVTIRLINVGTTAPAAGTTVTGADVVVPITVAQQGTRVTVPLNYYLAVGNYKLSNSSGAVARFTAFTGTYPLSSGPISVTGSYTSATATTYSTTTYNSFFNLTFAPGCESARTAINVNVATPPALTYTGTPSVCAGGSTVLTFSPASYTTLTVNPTTGATVSGNTITFNPAATTTYTITGNDGTGAAGCTATTTATITLTPTPNAPTFTGTATVCAGSSTTLTFAPATPSATILSVADFEAGANGFTASPASTNPVNGFTRQTGTYSLGTGPVSYTGPNAAGTYYVADSDKNGTVFTSTLTSPAFSTVNYSAATISVQQYYRYSAFDYAGIDYSIDNGVTWTDLLVYPGTVGSNSGVQGYSTYALPADALNKTQVKFRFYYDVDNDYYWAIDNVSVTGVPIVQTYAVVPTAGATVTGNTIAFNPSATTSYSVTVSNGNGCPSPGTPVTITVNTLAIWTGAVSTSWFDGGNWNNGCVPTRNIDATVPASLTNYPALTTTAAAEVRTLTLANGGSLAQSAGTLNVYGDLTSSTPAANVTLTGGNIAFLGAMPTVTGLSGLYNLTVNLSSAAGTLTLANNATVNHALTLTQGTLTTGTYAVALAPTATVTETDASYVLGQVSVPGRNLSTTAAETFGGIGLTLTPDAASTVFPGQTTVVRTTGTVLTGVGTSVSIKRYFDIQPATNTGLNVAMDFSYFDHERNGIAAGNVALFKSVSGTSGPWANQQPITIAGNTVSKTGITDFSIWTLGSVTNPLPVELTAFTAERQGSNTALAWTTATEKSSRGFEVQMSTDGRTFRVLDFVASATPTSTSPRYYSYLDREAGKTGLRYYRLRQVDLNGTASFSPVRTVRFEGETSLRLTAAPNPFQQRLTLTVELPAGTVAAPAQLSLTDAAGRTLLKQTTPILPAGVSQLELNDLAKLASGVYILRLEVPGQPIQHLKVVKE